MAPGNDQYFRKALIEGYRARSAYKLLQLARCFNLFKDTKNVIDLCAAPGSWTQVISNQLHNLKNITESDKIKLRDDVKIVAVDLAPIKPVPGVTSLVADITDVETHLKLKKLFENEKVDVIVCDGAHDVSGMVLADFQLHLGLITACIHIILQTLKDDGSFVAKIFNTWGCQIFVSQLKIFFKEVVVVKPHSSRPESYECFAVCKRYCKPKDFDPLQLTPYLNYAYRDFSSLTGIHKYYIPFLVLGCYDINQNEFMELHKEYGDELYEKPDLIEELLVKDDLTDFKKSIQIEPEKFFSRVLNRGKVGFGVSRKLFIVYLTKYDKIDFDKTIDDKSILPERYVDMFTEERTNKHNDEDHVSNTDKNLIAQLFEGFSLDSSSRASTDPPEEEHVWFRRNLEENAQEKFEDFDLESLLEKTDDEFMKIIRENNASLHDDDSDLLKKFSLLEDPNSEVLKAVKQRRDILEEIQKFVEENKL